MNYHHRVRRNAYFVLLADTEIVAGDADLTWFYKNEREGKQLTEVILNLSCK